MKLYEVIETGKTSEYFDGEEQEYDYDFRVGIFSTKEKAIACLKDYVKDCPDYVEGIDSNGNVYYYEPPIDKYAEETGDYIVVSIRTIKVKES